MQSDDKLFQPILYGYYVVYAGASQQWIGTVVENIVPINYISVNFRLESILVLLIFISKNYFCFFQTKSVSR